MFTDYSSEAEYTARPEAPREDSSPDITTEQLSAAATQAGLQAGVQGTRGIEEIVETQDGFAPQLSTPGGKPEDAEVSKDSADEEGANRPTEAGDGGSGGGPPEAAIGGEDDDRSPRRPDFPFLPRDFDDNVAPEIGPEEQREVSTLFEGFIDGVIEQADPADVVEDENVEEGVVTMTAYISGNDGREMDVNIRKSAEDEQVLSRSIKVFWDAELLANTGYRVSYEDENPALRRWDERGEETSDEGSSPGVLVGKQEVRGLGEYLTPSGPEVSISPEVQEAATHSIVETYRIPPDELTQAYDPHLVTGLVAGADALQGEATPEDPFTLRTYEANCAYHEGIYEFLDTRPPLMAVVEVDGYRQEFSCAYAYAREDEQGNLPRSLQGSSAEIMLVYKNPDESDPRFQEVHNLILGALWSRLAPVGTTVKVTELPAEGSSRNQEYYLPGER